MRKTSDYQTSIVAYTCMCGTYMCTQCVLETFFLLNALQMAIHVAYINRIVIIIGV